MRVCVEKMEGVELVCAGAAADGVVLVDGGVAKKLNEGVAVCCCCCG